MTVVLGADGFPGGWVCAVLDGGGLHWELLPDAAAVLAVETSVTGVDVPIGLPESGPRACDLAARRELGPRASSVYPAPARAVLGATSYDDACARSRRATGRALSRQAYGILARIADVDAALGPVPPERVVEVHPEVSFRRLAGEVLPTKHSAAGLAARIRALLAWRPDVLVALEVLPPGPRLDDALDALAVTWSAQRHAAGSSAVLPDGAVPVDARGRLMRIVV